MAKDMSNTMGNKKGEKRNMGNKGTGQNAVKVKDDFSTICSDILSGAVTVGIVV